ncbi:MAG: S46 family peptidase [Lewinellaceae bacterium]|nr:S46 family peptidase [Lewinellaceae bacterium]
MQLKKFLSALSLTILVPCLAFSQEGMWLPNLLEQNEAEMRNLGMKMAIEDIYSLNRGSLKDAVVLFGGGCTAGIISPNGLLLTNHHCGDGYIQNHSTLENNILENGFWAPALADELPNPGLTVTFISRIDDVTAQALEGVSEDLPPRERQSIIDRNLDQVRKTAVKADYEVIEIKPFFEGTQYIQFTEIVYRDIRLVGTPPVSIGNFGHDTDNWVWPRHAADFSLFRIYAGPDNLPADYSPDNVPYVPKRFLPISLKGVKEGDFTLVMGFPARTNSYLSSYGIKEVLEVVDPIRVGMRDISLAIIRDAMRKDPATKLQYASKESDISNGWKKWMGEMEGLRRTQAVRRKQHLEEQFMELLREDPELTSKYGHLLEDFRSIYTEREPFQRASIYYSEAVGVNVELFRAAFRLARLVRTFGTQGEPGYRAVLPATKNYLETFYPEFDAGLDQRVFAGIMEKYLLEVIANFLPESVTDQVEAYKGDFSAWAANVYENTLLTKPDQLFNLLEKTPEEVMEALNADPFYKLTIDLNQAYSENVAPVANEYAEQLAELQRQYMQAQMEAFPKRHFYPDANFSLRVTFGQVAGYSPRDAVKYGYHTTLDGVMEKYVPGDYEFDLPERLINLYQAKDYGPYGVKGELPVDFIGTNHTSGGNSGSPVVDAYGNLIGLNFDRAWEGTMSDINYDASRCRNIMVDARYILFIIDKYAGAKRLVEEMKLIR